MAPTKRIDPILTITANPNVQGEPSVEDIFAIHDETPGVDPVSDDTADPLPSEITSLATGLTLVNASKKAIPFTFGSDGFFNRVLDFFNRRGVCL